MPPTDESNDDNEIPLSKLGPLKWIGIIVVALGLIATGVANIGKIYKAGKDAFSAVTSPKKEVTQKEISTCIKRVWCSRDLQRQSRSYGSGNWEISYPNTSPYEHIGWLIEPDLRPSGGVNDFAMHDAHLLPGHPYTPDPTYDWVIYEFSQPTTVPEVQVRQHQNGIMRITGDLGEDGVTFPLSLASASVEAQHNVALPEGAEQTFTFGDVSQSHPPEGKFFRIRIAETVNDAAQWATYRLIPRDKGHQPFMPCGIDK